MSTADIAISTTAYTQIAGPGSVAATVTTTRPAQYAFSATQPAITVVGHHLEPNSSVPLGTMGTGIYMWMISEFANAVAIITLGVDATINNGSSFSVTTTPPADYTATGNISALNANLGSGSATANSTVATATMNGVSTATIEVTGTFSETLLVQITTDGSNWTALPTITKISDSTTAANITAVGNYQVSVPAAAQARVTCSAFTSGSATVTVRASTGVGGSGGGAAGTVTVSSSALPTGASTSAKQPALGTAGTASLDVLTIQGVASMTPVRVDGSGVTQPVSGTVTANFGTLNGVATNAGITGVSSKTLTDINTTLGTPLQAGGTVAIANLDVALSTRLKPADTLAGITTVAAVTAITNALPAGTNLLGKTGIDQTTPGTTNKVSIGTDGTVAINTALPTGTNSIGQVTANAGANLNTSALALDATLTGKTQTTRFTDGTNDITMITGSSDATSATSNRVPVQSHNKAYNGTTWDLLRAVGAGVKSAFVGVLNTLPQVIYNSTPQTLTNGQGTDLQGDANGYLKVNVAAGSGITATVSQTGFKVSQSYTRPANTTAYVIGYAISASTSAGAQLTYSAVGSANQYGVIERVEIMSTQKGATLPQILAYISGATLSSATVNDGVALEIDASTYALGMSTIPCVETSNTAARSKTIASGLNQPFKLDSSGNFYVVLEALNAYTPASGEVLTVVISGVLR